MGQSLALLAGLLVIAGSVGPWQTRAAPGSAPYVIDGLSRDAVAVPLALGLIAFMVSGTAILDHRTPSRTLLALVGIASLGFVFAEDRILTSPGELCFGIDRGSGRIVTSCFSSTVGAGLIFIAVGGSAAIAFAVLGRRLGAAPSSGRRRDLTAELRLGAVAAAVLGVLAAPLVGRVAACTPPCVPASPCTCVGSWPTWDWPRVLVSVTVGAVIAAALLAVAHAMRRRASAP